MNRTDYENKSFDELIDQLCDEGKIVSYDTLTDYIIDLINEGSLLSASNILNVLRDSDAYWYDYDFGLVTPLTCKEDLADYIED